MYDESARRVGTIADAQSFPGLVFVRPLGGGKEWETRRENLRPARASEVLAERVRKERATRGML